MRAMQLDAVKARALGPLRAQDKILDQLLDFLCRKSARAGLRMIRRSDWNGYRFLCRPDAGVMQLQARDEPLRLDRCGEPRQPFDVIVGPYAGLSGAALAFALHIGSRRHDEA